MVSYPRDPPCDSRHSCGTQGAMVYIMGPTSYYILHDPHNTDSRLQVSGVLAVFHLASAAGEGAVCLFV